MRLFLVTVMLILFVGIVAAEEGIQITEVSSKTILQPDETGQYTLKVENLGSKSYQLQVLPEPYAGLPTSDFDYVFVDPDLLTLNGHESAEVKVDIKLKDDVLRQKRYKTYITISALNDPSVSEKYTLQVFAMAPKDPITMYVSDVGETVAPGGEFSVTVTLVNKLSQNLNNIDLYISSDIFEDKQTIQLFTEQERTIPLSFPIAVDAPPGSHGYNIRLYFDNELRTTVNGTFTVQEHLDVSQKVETTTAFLYTETRVVKTNNGNTVVSDSFSYPQGFVAKWFSSYSIEPTARNSGAQWIYTLTPGESFTATIITDYRPGLIALIVIIILAIIISYLYTKRVTVRKDVFKHRYSTEGLSNFKVLLHIRNRTNKPVKDLTVMDRLPRIIQPSTTFGTLHPAGVERGDQGVRIMWTIPELVKGEERIISYDVEAKTKVLGVLTLPPALVKFKNQAGRSIQIRSNSARVSTPEAKAEARAQKQEEKKTKKAL